MAAVLIAVILALVLGHTLPQIAALRRFDGFERWLDWLEQGGLGDAGRGRLAVLASVGLPVLLMLALQTWLSGAWFGLPGFLLSMAVLAYCWGPRDLDQDVAHIAEAEDAESRQSRAQALLGVAGLDGGHGVTGVFRGARARWFGPLLWFIVLGPAGALLYRLAVIGAARPAGSLSADHHALLQRLQAILDWPVSQLMTLALALVGNFDSVAGAWRDWHAAQGRGVWQLGDGYLDAAARASVRIELAEAAAEADEALADGEVPLDDAPEDAVQDGPLAELRDAMSLVWRILLAWLAVLALLVLAGFVH